MLARRCPEKGTIISIVVTYSCKCCNVVTSQVTRSTWIPTGVARLWLRRASCTLEQECLEEKRVLDTDLASCLEATRLPGKGTET